jgi:hypothetical protein
VVLAIVAIETDPNPLWSRRPNKSIDDIQNDIVQMVGYKMMILHQRLITQTNGQVTSVSAFHVLHHLSRWTEELCPFEKPRNP